MPMWLPTRGPIGVPPTQEGRFRSAGPPGTWCTPPCPGGSSATDGVLSSRLLVTGGAGHGAGPSGQRHQPSTRWTSHGTTSHVQCHSGPDARHASIPAGVDSTYHPPRGPTTSGPSATGTNTTSGTEGIHTTSITTRGHDTAPSAERRAGEHPCTGTPGSHLPDTTLQRGDQTSERFHRTYPVAAEAPSTTVTPLTIV